MGVSRVLVSVAQKEGVEVLFCGKQSMDGDNAQVPSMLGELLDWVTVPVISSLEVDGVNSTAHTDLGSGTTAIVKGAFQLCSPVIKISNKPRNPNLK